MIPETEKIQFQAFIDILYMLSAGESKEYDIYLYSDLAKYDYGLYRVRKTINLTDKNMELTVEFTIE